MCEIAVNERGTMDVQGDKKTRKKRKKIGRLWELRELREMKMMRHRRRMWKRSDKTWQRKRGELMVVREDGGDSPVAGL
jgi:hypothetical protein